MGIIIIIVLVVIVLAALGSGFDKYDGSASSSTRGVRTEIDIGRDGKTRTTTKYF